MSSSIKISHTKLLPDRCKGRLAVGIVQWIDGTETLFHMALLNKAFYYRQPGRILFFRKSTRDYANCKKGDWIVDNKAPKRNDARAKAILKHLGIDKIDAAEERAIHQAYTARIHAIEKFMEN